MRRASRAGFLLSCLAIAVAIGGITFRDVLLARLGTPWPKVLPLAAGLLPSCVIMPICAWRLRGLRRGWKASGGRLCPHCGYDVSSLAPAGRCPECGKGYDIDADLVMWRLAGLDRESDRRSDRSEGEGDMPGRTHEGAC